METGRSPSNIEQLGIQFQEILKNPEPSLHTSTEDAQKESNIVQQLLNISRTKKHTVNTTQFILERTNSMHYPTIRIVWKKDDYRTAQLTLNPTTDSKNGYGYTGMYETITINKRTFKEHVETYSLEELFKAPEGVKFVIRPTITKWAIGKNDTYEKEEETDTYTMYMGLGFLLLGEPWMLVGFHEAGHIPIEKRMRTILLEENPAWSIASRNYAGRHHEKRIHDSGLFDLLKKPTDRDIQRTALYTQPTIGEIIQYGLVSHGKSEARIPEQWSKKEKEIIHTFQQIISHAQNAFLAMFV